MENSPPNVKPTTKLNTANQQYILRKRNVDGQGAELITAYKELQKAEEKIKKASHLYAFISQVNQKIVRVKDEATLFRNACSMALEFGQFKMAWIGLFDDTREKIVLVEHCGLPEEEFRLFIDASYQCKGSQDYVLSNGTYYICNDIENDLEVKKLRPFALRHGIRSYMVLPIKKSGIIIGTLNLYSTEADFVGKEEIKLLVEVSGDISFALDLFGKDKQHKAVEKEIKASEVLYHSLFDNMLEGFAYCKMIYENGVAQDFMYLNVNNAFEKLTGLKNVAGKKVSEVIPGFKDANPELLETYGRVALTGKAERSEVYMKSLKMWLDVSVYSTEKGYFTAVFDVITEKKNAEEKLVNSERHFRALIENGADMKSLSNNEGKVLYSSPSIHKGLGYTMEEFSVLYPYHLIHPEDLNDYLERRDKLLQLPGKSFTFQQRRRHKNGTWIWCEGTLTNLLDEPGVHALVTNFRDISERKKAEKEILLSEARLKEAQAIAHISNWEIDMLTGVHTWSDEFYKIFGINKGQVQPSTEAMLSFIHPNDLDFAQKQIAEAFGTLTDASSNFRFMRKDGAMRYGHIEWKFEFDKNRNPLRLYGILQDITTQKEAEEKIKESEMKYRSLIEQASDAIVVINFDGSLLEVNKSTETLFGYPKAELLKMKMNELVFAEDPSPRIDEVANGKAIVYERRMKRKDETSVNVEISAGRVDDGRLIAIFRNVSERKKAEYKVAELNEVIKVAYYQQSSILNALPSSIALLDGNGTILAVNESWKKFADANNLHCPNYCVGHNYLEVCAKATGADKEYGLEMHIGIMHVLEGGGNRFEMEYPCHSPKEKRWFNVQVRPLSKAKNAGAVVMHINITALKHAHNAIININNELEERVTIRTDELLAANKSLEAFSYSVSHDLRSPVRSIVGFSKLIKKEYGQEMKADMKELFTFIEASGMRMNAIIDDLLSFAKWGKETLYLTEVDMTALFAHVWNNTLQESPHHAILELQPLPNVQADKAMIRQVVVNLISNAVKYSSKKENPVVKVGFEKTNTELIFHVTDNGAGFDMANYSRLFSTFQRLHSVSDFEGTGIGLAMIKTIIEKHNGRVWAEGKVNEGATFYFSLPLP